MGKTSSAAILLGAALCLLSPGLMAAPARADEAKLVPAAIAGPVALKYPKDAQLRGEEGEIYMYVFVAADGRPTGRARVAQSTGYDDLDNAALESALGWKYTAARSADGSTRSSWCLVHVKFKLPAMPGGAPPQAL